jgi:integrase
MAIKVALREKKILKGRKSLYLDIYPPIPHPKTGEPTRREFLGMYIIEKPKNSLEKQNNKETVQIAEQIRQQRENLLNKPEIYSEYEKEKLRIKEQGERDFIVYFNSLRDKRKTTNYDNWVSAGKYLEKFTGGKLKFSELNEQFFNDFKEYLLSTKSNKDKNNTLSQNSAVSYFNKVKATLKQAYKDGILQTDLNSKISVIKPAETQREFLTVEELNTLVTKPCKDEVLKRAALFSALTGLRYSDIEKLIWNELEYIEGQGYFIKFTQQKTKGVEMLPISEQAYSLLGEIDEPQNKVFKGLRYSAYHNKHLREWVKSAGINKKISFHNFRHTFATLQLANGTDIYTVSKMLGHRELKTTQIYAKVVDKAKREAADKIKLNF